MPDIPIQDEASSALPTPLGALRSFARKRQSGQGPARSQAERCELCSEVIAPSHSHLLKLSNRELVCVCQPCSVLFSEQGAGAGKYRLVPGRYLALPDFHMADEQWESLHIPVNMAFLFPSTGTKPVMAYYPSPAGATESLLELEEWQTLVNDNPVLRDLTPDVEALLVNRLRGACDYYIVPIDACYRLVGLIRLAWRGLGGGTEVWDAIAGFFQEIRAKARQVRGREDA